VSQLAVFEGLETFFRPALPFEVLKGTGVTFSDPLRSQGLKQLKEFVVSDQARVFAS